MLRHVKFSPLPVSDLDRAIAFWRDVVGLSLATDEAYGDGWRWVEMEVDRAATRILFTRRQGDTPSEAPDLILVCDDVDATYAAMQARGCAFTQPPAEAPWSAGERYALFRDSEGNLIMLGDG